MSAQLVCPANLAYGPQGKPPTIPGQSTLVFDVELLEIVKPEPPVVYEYSPRLPPALRFDPTGRPDWVPALLEKARKEKLSDKGTKSE